MTESSKEKRQEWGYGSGIEQNIQRTLQKQKWQIIP